MKSTLFNFLYLNVIRFSNMLIPLAMIPLVQGILPPNDSDLVFIFLSSQALSQVIIDYSSSLTTVNLFKNGDKKKLFSVVLLSKIILMLFCTFSFYFYIDVVLGLEDVKDIVLAFAFLNTSFVLFSNWYLLIESDLKYSSLIQLISKGISVFSLYYIDSGSVDLVLYSIAIPPLIFAVISFFQLIKKYDIKIDFKSRASFFYLKRNLVVFIGESSPMLYNTLPMLLIPVLLPGQSFTIFFAINKLSSFCISIYQSFSRALLPQLNQKSNHNKNIVLFFISSLSVVTLLFFLKEYAYDFMRLQNVDSTDAVLAILLISTIPAAISTYLTYCFFASKGASKYLSKFNFCLSILCMLITISLMQYGVLELALGFLISRILFSLLLLYLSRNLNNEYF